MELLEFFFLAILSFLLSRNNEPITIIIELSLEAKFYFFLFYFLLLLLLFFFFFYVIFIFYRSHRNMRLVGQHDTKRLISLVHESKPLITVLTAWPLSRDVTAWCTSPLISSISPNIYGHLSREWKPSIELLTVFERQQWSRDKKLRFQNKCEQVHFIQLPVVIPMLGFSNWFCLLDFVLQCGSNLLAFWNHRSPFCLKHGTV